MAFIALEVALELIEAVKPLMPLVRAVQAGPGDGRAHLRLERYRMPLDGLPGGLSGDLALVFDFVAEKKRSLEALAETAARSRKEAAVLRDALKNGGLI